MKKLKLTKFQQFKLVTFVLMVVGLTAFAYFRGVDFKECVAAKYDLKRETEFRIFTGACTTAGKDGKLVYVKQLRGIGGDDTGGSH